MMIVYEKLKNNNNEYSNEGVRTPCEKKRPENTIRFISLIPKIPRDSFISSE